METTIDPKEESVGTEEEQKLAIELSVAVENATIHHPEAEDIVTAFNIEATTDKGIDYDKLIVKFGCSAITEEIKQKIADLTGAKPHRFIRRNIFFCHRDLDIVLHRYEQRKLFYLYTGRGPSADALHLGHAIPFIFNQYLQEAFDVPLVVQITDDEKYIHQPELELN
jgi:tryptophanyl-tRNA synthetase